MHQPIPACTFEAIVTQEYVFGAHVPLAIHMNTYALMPSS